MVYFNSLEIGYVYDDQTETMFKFDYKSKIFTAVMKGSLSLNQGKLLRKSRDEEILFVRTGKGEITVLSSLMDSTNYHQIQLFSSKNHSIVDFNSLDFCRVISVSDLGEIVLGEKVEKEELEFKVLERYQLDLFENEEVTCLGISRCSKYISISTKNGTGNHLSRLFFLKLSKNSKNDGQIIERFIVDMRKAEYSLKPESHFYEINMDLVNKNGDIVLLCYQRYGGNYLIPLIFKKNYLETYSDPLKIHNGLFGNASPTPDFDSVWSIDAKGNLISARFN